ncbi:MAG: hypothetical protein H6705_00230 [Myxococcales bacterium]|nr:hypothetical protein [Myxococcales bacterium]
MITSTARSVTRRGPRLSTWSAGAAAVTSGAKLRSTPRGRGVTPTRALAPTSPIRNSGTASSSAVPTTRSRGPTASSAAPAAKGAGSACQGPAGGPRRRRGGGGAGGGGGERPDDLAARDDERRPGRRRGERGRRGQGEGGPRERRGVDRGVDGGAGRELDGVADAARERVAGSAAAVGVQHDPELGPGGAGAEREAEAGERVEVGGREPGADRALGVEHEHREVGEGGPDRRQHALGGASPTAVKRTCSTRRVVAAGERERDGALALGGEVERDLGLPVEGDAADPGDVDAAGGGVEGEERGAARGEGDFEGDGGVGRERVAGERRERGGEVDPAGERRVEAAFGDGLAVLGHDRARRAPERRAVVDAQLEVARVVFVVDPAPAREGVGGGEVGGLAALDLDPQPLAADLGGEAGVGGVAVEDEGREAAAVPAVDGADLDAAEAGELDAGDGERQAEVDDGDLAAGVAGRGFEGELAEGAHRADAGGRGGDVQRVGADERVAGQGDGVAGAAHGRLPRLDDLVELLADARRGVDEVVAHPRFAEIGLHRGHPASDQTLNDSALRAVS